MGLAAAENRPELVRPRGVQDDIEVPRGSSRADAVADGNLLCVHLAHNSGDFSALASQNQRWQTLRLCLMRQSCTI